MAADFQIQDFGMKYCEQLALYVLYRLSKAEDFFKIFFRSCLLICV